MTTFLEMTKIDIDIAAAAAAVVDTAVVAAVGLGTWVVVVLEDTDTVHQDQHHFVVVEGMDRKMEAVAAFLMFLVVVRLLLATMVDWVNE